LAAASKPVELDAADVAPVDLKVTETNEPANAGESLSMDAASEQGAAKPEAEAVDDGIANDAAPDIEAPISKPAPVATPAEPATVEPIPAVAETKPADAIADIPLPEADVSETVNSNVAGIKEDELKGPVLDSKDFENYVGR